MAKVGRIRGVVVRAGRIMAKGVPFGGEDKAEVEERRADERSSGPGEQRV